MFDATQKLCCHFRPEKGWMNDPNGLVYFKGKYHAFFQHAPHFEKPWKENMCWGHAATEDFLHWEELPVALEPELPYDSRGCWSGTAIVHEGKLFLFYASVQDVTDEAHGYYWKQTVSVACSEDGVHFTKYAGNPLISLVPEDGREEDFRDPAICRVGDRFLLAIASANPEKTKGRLLLYESRDLFSWEYKGIAHEWDEAIYCECPSIMPYGDELLMTVSVCFFAGSEFFATIGTLENGRFVSRVKSVFQKGPDNYAGQVFTDEKGRRLLLSWIPGWSYQDFAERSLGCLSLPLEITEQNGVIRAFPIPEVRHLLKDEDPCVERTETGFRIRREARPDVVFEGEIRDLKVLRDGYIVEVFVNGGEQVFTAVLC